MGVVINKVNNSKLPILSELLTKYELEILGAIPYDSSLEEEHKIDKESKIVQDAVKSFYSRLNLPQ